MGYAHKEKDNPTIVPERRQTPKNIKNWRSL